MRCRGTSFSHSMDSIVPVQKTKTSQETQRRLQKFLELDRKPKVTMRTRKAWDLSKNVFELKTKGKATFYSLTEAQVMQAPSSKKPEER